MKTDFSKYFIREKAIQSIRQFFIDKNFHEIDVPIILPSLPLEPNLYALKTNWTHHCQDFYLITSPESSLKKLIAQGIGNCFAISKVFRDLEDIGPTHNLEFTMLEWYEMDKDYYSISQTVQDLILNAFHQQLSDKNTNTLTYQGNQIDLTPPWPKTTLKELFRDYAGIDLAQNLTLDEIKITAKNKGYNIDGVDTWEPLFTQIFVNEIEPNLQKNKPLFIFDYPTQTSPLCQPCLNQPGFSQRFEFYIGGMEIGNAYTELADSNKIKTSFLSQNNFRQTKGLPTHPIDQEFIDTASQLPQCAGIGVGIDRLAMLFADTGKIEDIVYFPTSQLI